MHDALIRISRGLDLDHTIFFLSVLWSGTSFAAPTALFPSVPLSPDARQRRYSEDLPFGLTYSPRTVAAPSFPTYRCGHTRSVIQTALGDADVYAIPCTFPASNVPAPAKRSQNSLGSLPVLVIGNKLDAYLADSTEPPPFNTLKDFGLESLFLARHSRISRDVSSHCFKPLILISRLCLDSCMSVFSIVFVVRCRVRA